MRHSGVPGDSEVASPGIATLDLPKLRVADDISVPLLTVIPPPPPRGMTQRALRHTAITIRDTGGATTVTHYRSALNPAL